MPTLAAITGSTKGLPHDIDGMDISPLFYGKNVDTDHRYLYWEFPGKQRAIRYADWKAESIGRNHPIELYNITKDPFEKNNLAAEYPKMVKKLDKMMKKMHHPSADWPLPGEPGYVKPVKK